MITKGIAHTISTYRIQWSRVSATYNRQSISPTSCRGTVAGLSSSSLYRFSSSSNRPRSPFAILKLKTSATEQNIKAAFRKVSIVGSSFNFIRAHQTKPQYHSSDKCFLSSLLHMHMTIYISYYSWPKNIIQI